VSVSLSLPETRHSPIILNSFRIALFCSKVGAAQVKLKLVLTSYPEGHTFTFTAPPPTATAEREAFKTEITNHISRNRNVQSLALPATATPSFSPATTPAPNTPFAAPTPRLVPSVPGTSTPRPISATSDSRASSTSANDVTSDYRLRKRALLSSPELAALHRELVMTGQITENEFWDGREVHFLFSCFPLVDLIKLASICCLRKLQQKRNEKENQANWSIRVRRLSTARSKSS
jgi:hypothetical protein